MLRPRRRTINAWDILPALAAPRSVFARVEDVFAYGWTLAILLTAVTVLGYALVQTGLIDRRVEARVEAQVAELEATQMDIVARSELSKLIANKRQEGEFNKLMARVGVVAARPLATLAIALLLPAMLYGVVALTGKKPEWHTLVTIAVFASFADVAGQAVRLGFMLRFQTLEVDTSMGLLARWMSVADPAAAQSRAAVGGLLTAVDPFRMWFWIMMATGLHVTMQLSRWKAWLGCGMCWLVAAIARAGIAVAAIAQPPS